MGWEQGTPERITYILSGFEIGRNKLTGGRSEIMGQKTVSEEVQKGRKSRNGKE